jgi:hypothetical protein
VLGHALRLDVACHLPLELHPLTSAQSLEIWKKMGLFAGSCRGEVPGDQCQASVYV